jgi:hypothetical protein
MAMRKLFVALLVTSAWLILGGSASAAFPNFSDCPTAANVCLDVQNTSGNLNIKGFNVPLHRSMEIRGGLVNGVFTAPRGTNGFFGTPVPVPGGLIGIEWIPGNSVLAITELAGPTSAIEIETGAGNITIPIKVRLVNVLLGMDCHIGTNSHPVVLNLITGTTSPPPPNRPISGAPGSVAIPDRNHFTFTGNVNVENSFAVPGASECGLGLGLINGLVNLKLGLPSSAGNNSVSITNDVSVELRLRR